MSKSKIYIVCIIIFIIGLLVFFFNVKYNLLGLKKSLIELNFPGTRTVTLKNDGIYSVYHQFEGYIDGNKINNESLRTDLINLQITKLPNKNIVELKKPDSIKKYRYMGRKGIKMLEFENKGVNEYIVKSFLKGDSDPKNYILTLEHNFEFRRIKGIITSQVALLIPILLSLILFMRTYIRK